jgi:membrane protein DedA with SNARE-associated domain
VTIEALVARYGLAALFAGAALEGEAAVIAGGLLAHQGLFWLPAAMAVAALGSFSADQGWFALGRGFRDNRRVAAARQRPAFARALAALERHPIAFIFAFRFIYGIRTISPIAIGTTGVSRLTFLIVNAVSAIVWGITFTTIGYVFGNAFERAVGRLRHDPRLWWLVGALVVGGLVVGLIVRWRQRERA